MRPLIGCGRMFYDVRSEDTFTCGTVGVCDQCRRELLDEMFRRARREREEANRRNAGGGLLRRLFSDRYGPDLFVERRKGGMR